MIGISLGRIYYYSQVFFLITGDLICGLGAFFCLDLVVQEIGGTEGDSAKAPLPFVEANLMLTSSFFETKDSAKAPLPFVEANLMLTSSFFETKRDSDLISTSPSLKQSGEDFARLFRFFVPEEETPLGLKKNVPETRLPPITNVTVRLGQP
jgi:hypothetical protein